MPRAPAAPGIVFVHGSGTLTRDDWYGWPEQLAQRGIATLAYDKPGAGETGGDWTTQTLEDRAIEALAAVACLRGQSGVDSDRVGLVGLSQGSWVAPLAASRSDEVAFVVALSGAGVTPAAQEEYRIEQEMLAATLTPSEIDTAVDVYRRRLALMRNGANVEEVFAAEAGAREHGWFEVLGGATPDRLRFLFGIYDFDPLPALETTRCPVLAIWGERDILVPVEPSVSAFAESLMRGGNDDVELRVLPGADHELQLIEAQSSEEAEAFARQLIDDVAAWIHRHAGRRTGT